MSFEILQPLNRVQLPGSPKITCVYGNAKKYFIGFSNGDLTIMSMSTQPEPIKAEQKSIRSLRSLSEFRRLFVDNDVSQLLVQERSFKNVTGNQAPIVTLDSLPLYQDQNRHVLIIGNPEILQVFEWVGSHLNLMFSFDEVKSYNQFAYTEHNPVSLQASLHNQNDPKSDHYGTPSKPHNQSKKASRNSGNAKEDLDSLTRIFLLGSQKKLLIYEIVRKSRNIFDFVYIKEFLLKSRLKEITWFPKYSLAVLGLLSGFLTLDLCNGYALKELRSEQTNNFTQSSSFGYFGLSSSSPEVSVIPYTKTSSLVVRDSEVGRLEYEPEGLFFYSDSNITLLATPIATAFLRPNYLLAVYAKTFEVIEITSGQLVQTFKYQLRLTNTLLCVNGSVATIISGNTILQFLYLSYQKQLDQFVSARGEITPNKKKDVANDLQLFGLERAISLLSFLDENDGFFENELENHGSPLKTKNLHLRDLFKEKAIVYFEVYSRYHEALVDIASDWIITYTEILRLYPDFLNGNIQIKQEISQDKPTRAKSVKSITLKELKEYIESEALNLDSAEKSADAQTIKMENFMKAINNLIIYLTDQRRIHLSLLSNEEDNPYITWKSVHIDAGDLYPGVDKMKLRSRLETSACAIDTTLFLCYFYAKPLLLGPLLRLPNNKCDATIVKKCLLEKIGAGSGPLGSYMSQLLDFYFGRHLHKDALEMLRGLSGADSIPRNELDEFLEGPGLTVRYLQKLTNHDLDLVLHYSEIAMVEHPDSTEKIAQMVFMNDTYECESYDNYKVLEFFEAKIERPDFARCYLEWLLHRSDILENPSRKKDREKLGTRLCLIYLTELKSFSGADDEFSQTEAYKRLRTILDQGRDFVPWTVLKNIPLSEDRFLRLTVLVYRKLGEHVKSVDILYNQLGDFDSAMHYCAEIFKEPNRRKIGQDLLHKLLEDLLMSYEENIDLVAKLLTSEGSKMSSFYILTALPKSFPLNKISSYLQSSLQIAEEQAYFTRIKGQLYKVGSAKLKRNLLLAESKSFLVISEREACPICGQNFGRKVLCLTPENKIVHYSCYKPTA